MWLDATDSKLFSNIVETSKQSFSLYKICTAYRPKKSQKNSGVTGLDSVRTIVILHQKWLGKHQDIVYSTPRNTGRYLNLPALCRED